jgi:NADH-quinone oxidoreductase subunit N
MSNFETLSYLFFESWFMLFLFFFLLCWSTFLIKFKTYQARDRYTLSFIVIPFFLGFLYYSVSHIRTKVYLSFFFEFYLFVVKDAYSLFLQKSLLIFSFVLFFVITLYVGKVPFYALVEFYLVFFFFIFFSGLLLVSWDLILAYLSLEGASLTLYVLVAHPFKQGAIEAAFKYLGVGILASGLLLFGIFLIFFVIGSFNFSDILTFFDQAHGYTSVVELGVLSILISFLFKISAVPLHMWALDTYEATWAPVTAILMVLAKLVFFFFFIKLFCSVFAPVYYVWHKPLIVSAIGSLMIGCFGSIAQVRLKRLFIYTSISQTGFVLLGLASGSIQGLSSALFHLYLYLISMLFFLHCFFIHVIQKQENLFIILILLVWVNYPLN